MNLKKLIFYALFSAMICVVTIVLAIPIAQGYINLSDTLIMLLAPFVLSSGAFLIGAIGCGLADIFLGYGQYAIFTFLIKAIEWAIIAYLCKKIPSKYKCFIAYPIGALWMVCGYALVDSLIAASIAYFPVSFIANSTQGIFCIVFALVLAPILKPVFKKLKW